MNWVSNPTFLILVSLYLMKGDYAWANNPPAPPTALSEIALLPLVHILFLISGAAAIQASHVSERPQWRSVRILGIILLILFSFGNEGFAIPVSLFIGYLGLHKAFLIFSLSRKVEGAFRKSWGVFCSVLAVTVSVLLTGTSFAFFGYWASDRWLIDKLCYLHEAERRYLQNHSEPLESGYKYMNLLSTDRVPEGVAESDGIDLLSKAIRPLRDSLKSNEFKFSLDFKPDDSGYEIRIWPSEFVPWPYRVVSPRRAYYMDESGVVRYETVFSESPAAGPESQVLDTSEYPWPWLHTDLRKSETKSEAPP